MTKPEDNDDGREVFRPVCGHYVTGGFSASFGTQLRSVQGESNVQIAARLPRHRYSHCRQ